MTGALGRETYLKKNIKTQTANLSCTVHFLFFFLFMHVISALRYLREYMWFLRWATRDEPCLKRHDMAEYKVHDWKKTGTLQFVKKCEVLNVQLNSGLLRGVGCL